MITIKVRQNGSLLVEGEDVKLVDWNGQEYVLNKKPFALCRCGAVQAEALLRQLAQAVQLPGGRSRAGAERCAPPRSI